MLRVQDPRRWQWAGTDDHGAAGHLPELLTPTRAPWDGQLESRRSAANAARGSLRPGELQGARSPMNAGDSLAVLRTPAGRRARFRISNLISGAHRGTGFSVCSPPVVSVFHGLRSSSLSAAVFHVNRRRSRVVETK